MQEQIQLFRKLFSGRTDVIPKYWQSKNKQGYTPICKNEWDADLCSKPCHSCKNQDYTPLSDDLINSHIIGMEGHKIFLIGCYPLLDGNLCNFIAGDFDNHDGIRDPLSDIQAMAEVCEVQELPFYACLSKSGKGYHGYWFFDISIEAWKARAVYFACLEEAGIISDNDNISSFDRLFPNQDKLSGRGMGNLIALPLHRSSLGILNQPSRFLTPESNYTKEYPDQWAALQEFDSNRISLEQIDSLIAEWKLKPAKKINKTGKKTTYSDNDETLDINEILKGNIPKGQRDTLIFKYACRLREKGLSQQEAEIMCCNLVDKCEQSVDDKYTHDEARAKVQSAWKYEPGNNNDYSKEILSLPYSDIARADYFLNEHGENLKFSNTQKEWFVWSDKYWALDGVEYHRELAKQTCRNISQDFKQFAEIVENKKEKTELMKYANISESKKTLDNFLNLARSNSKISIKIDHFDNNKWLFNCSNGTINLKTGELQKHNKEELHSKISPISYDKTATCPLWINFLNDIFDNNQELIDFMQKSIGYAMTGIITEEVFWVFYGKGGNGKGTFINTIMNIFSNGHYGKQADFQTLFAPRNQQDDNILNQVAVLKGARFVTASEGQENAQLNENKIKELTSPDSGTVTGRFKYGNFFEYEPWYKIFLSSNYKPVIKGRDDGIWRRLMLVPFLKNFTGKDKDEKLKEKLKAESPGIINWMINGCLLWQKYGLNPPNIVLDATQQYKKDMDWLSDFFIDCCEINPVKNVPASNLYKKFLEWGGSIYSVQGRNTFYKSITDRGFIKIKIGGNVLAFQGLDIINDENIPDHIDSNKKCKFSDKFCERYNISSDCCESIPLSQITKCIFQ